MANTRKNRIGEATRPTVINNNGLAMVVHKAIRSSLSNGAATAIRSSHSNGAATASSISLNSGVTRVKTLILGEANQRDNNPAVEDERPKKKLQRNAN